MTSRSAAIGAAALAFALPLAGCGDDDSDSRPSGATATAGASSESAATRAPQPDRSVREKPRSRAESRRRREARGERVLPRPERDERSGRGSSTYRVPLIVRAGELAVAGGGAERGPYLATFVVEPGVGLIVIARGDREGSLRIDGPGRTRKVDLAESRSSIELAALDKGERYVLTLAGGDEQVAIKAR